MDKIKTLKVGRIKFNCLECDKEMTEEQVIMFKYACSQEHKDEWDRTCEDINLIEKKLCK